MKLNKFTYLIIFPIMFLIPKIITILIMLLANYWIWSLAFKNFRNLLTYKK
jgi:hypothetical protein